MHFWCLDTTTSTSEADPPEVSNSVPEGYLEILGNTEPRGDTRQTIKDPEDDSRKFRLDKQATLDKAM